MTGLSEALDEGAPAVRAALAQAALSGGHANPNPCRLWVPGFRASAVFRISGANVSGAAMVLWFAACPYSEKIHTEAS